MITTTLTIRQAKFVDEYVISGNAAAAARAAGYSERSAKVTASRMLTKANLKAAITERKHGSAEKFEIRREHILVAMLHAIAVAKECKKPGAMITGWREIGKMLGLYDPESIKADRRRMTPDGKEDIRHVPTAELLKRISTEGKFRNADGSAMTPAQIDPFYESLTTDELEALVEGRARVVTKVEMIEECH